MVPTLLVFCVCVVRSEIRRHRILKARAAVKTAYERHWDAIERRDSRDQHKASIAFTNARTEQLRLELGR